MLDTEGPCESKTSQPCIVNREFASSELRKERLSKIRSYLKEEEKMISKMKKAKTLYYSNPSVHPSYKREWD